MAYIQERQSQNGKIDYRVQVRLKGFQTATATFERKTDAKLWAQQTEAAMREGRYFKTSESKKHTLSELIDRYIENVIPTKPKNAPACTAQLRWWQSQIGYFLLADLTPALIAEHRDKLLNGITKKERESIRAGFGRLLRAKRNSLGISQEELAFRSGLHRTYVGSVECGERNLSLENIFIFAKAVDCSPLDLIPQN